MTVMTVITLVSIYITIGLIIFGLSVWFQSGKPIVLFHEDSEAIIAFGIITILIYPLVVWVIIHKVYKYTQARRRLKKKNDKYTSG